MSRPIFTIEEREQIRAEYDAGATMAQLAEKYNTSLMSISRSIVRAGGKTRPRGPRREINPPTRGLLGWLYEDTSVLTTEQIRERYNKFSPAEKADIQAAIRQALT